ncbi:hypothetical protein NE237_016784 [Protea cynaroides]|uniref:DUF4283 domain-containing protein n=1 Tax=Protea cynaroides TaxID=273540 RepID=A0A9Q0HFL0_9MAGN|nr:hypothetical protein NE237_016784 [Protea cynaroides]
MTSVNLGSIVVGSSAGNHVDGPWQSVMTRPTGPLNQNLAVNQTIQGGVFPLEAMNNGSDNVTDVLQMVGGGSQPEKISRCTAADVGVRRNISSPMERVDLGKFLGFPNLDDLVSKIDDVEILEDRVDQPRLHRRKRTRWTGRGKGKNPAMSAQPAVGVRSYAQVTGRLPDLNALPDPVVSGGMTRVVLPQDVVDRQFTMYQLGLIGRVFTRGVLLKDLLRILSELWSPSSKFEMTVMERGYFIFRFFSKEALMAGEEEEQRKGKRKKSRIVGPRGKIVYLLFLFKND